MLDRNKCIARTVVTIDYSCVMGDGGVRAFVGVAEEVAATETMMMMMGCHFVAVLPVVSLTRARI